jgi:hypothetical protein
VQDKALPQLRYHHIEEMLGALSDLKLLRLRPTVE